MWNLTRRNCVWRDAGVKGVKNTHELFLSYPFILSYYASSQVSYGLKKAKQQQQQQQQQKKQPTNRQINKQKTSNQNNQFIVRWVMVLPTFLFSIKSYRGFHLNTGKTYNLACEQALSIEKQCSYRVKSRYEI